MKLEYVVSLQDAVSSEVYPGYAYTSREGATATRHPLTDVEADEPTAIGCAVRVVQRLYDVDGYTLTAERLGPWDPRGKRSGVHDRVLVTATFMPTKRTKRTEDVA